MVDLSPLLQAAADELTNLGWLLTPPRVEIPVGTRVQVVGPPFAFRQGTRTSVAVPRRIRGHVVSCSDKDGDVDVKLDTGAKIVLNVDCLDVVEMI